MIPIPWKLLLLINLVALSANALFLLLAVLHVCPFVLPLLVLLACLGGSVWLSCWINGRTWGRRRQSWAWQEKEDVDG